VFGGAVRAACFRWLGKTLAVLTNGTFARSGCPRLATAGARRLCRESTHHERRARHVQLSDFCCWRRRASASSRVGCSSIAIAVPPLTVQT
jgi:hypothetical protein